MKIGNNYKRMFSPYGFDIKDITRYRKALLEYDRDTLQELSNYKGKYVKPIKQILEAEDRFKSLVKRHLEYIKKRFPRAYKISQKEINFKGVKI